MADLVKVTPNVRLSKRTDFSSHTGTVYVMEKNSEDGALKVWEIWATLGTITNFNNAPVGSILHDRADETKLYKHDTATTWKSVTFS